MARSANASGLTSWRGLTLGLAFTLSVSLSGAERRVTLQELGSRDPADYSSRYTGQTVVVRGIVNAPAFHFTEYNVLGLQDRTGGGVLKVSAGQQWLDSFHAGDEIEAEGKVVMQYGMPMIEPENILIVGHKAAPVPIEVSPRDAQDF